MTFTQEIPISGDSLGGTRDRIRTNFQQIFSVNGINHVDFNEADKGKHKFLQMPEVTASGEAVPSTAANEGGLYVEVGTSPAESNLFYRGESNGFQYQLTHVDQANSGKFGNNSAYVADHTGGWTFLPGGLIMVYGSRTSPGSSGTITFPYTFTTVFSVTATALRASGDRTVTISSTATTGFNYNVSASTTSIFFMAIGN